MGGGARQQAIYHLQLLFWDVCGGKPVLSHQVDGSVVVAVFV